MADRSTPRARFITFEGGEGVGKSTQVKRLVVNLNRRSVSAIRTREPGGTPKAEAVRTFILQGRSESWGSGAEAVLFAAARLDHVRQLIAPSLQGGKWVICDRFHDSTRAYQGLNGGLGERTIAALEMLALDNCRPDLTFILDMDPERAFSRIAERSADGVAAPADRFEKEDLDWHRRLRQAFVAIAEREPERCIVVSADQAEDDLEQAIWQALSNRFPELAQGGAG